MDLSTVKQLPGILTLPRDLCYAVLCYANEAGEASVIVFIVSCIVFWHWKPRVGPGQSPLSLHFPISPPFFSVFYFSIFPFLTRFIYFPILPE